MGSSTLRKPGSARHDEVGAAARAKGVPEEGQAEGGRGPQYVRWRTPRTASGTSRMPA